MKLPLGCSVSCRVHGRDWRREEGPADCCVTGSGGGVNDVSEWKKVLINGRHGCLKLKIYNWSPKCTITVRWIASGVTVDKVMEDDIARVMICREHVYTHRELLPI